MSSLILTWNILYILLKLTSSEYILNLYKLVDIYLENFTFIKKIHFKKSCYYF